MDGIRTIGRVALPGCIAAGLLFAGTQLVDEKLDLGQAFAQTAVIDLRLDETAAARVVPPSSPLRLEGVARAEHTIEFGHREDAGALVTEVAFVPITREGWTPDERVTWLLRVPAKVSMAELRRPAAGPWLATADGKAPRHAVEALRKRGLRIDRSVQVAVWTPELAAVGQPDHATAAPGMSPRQVVWLALVGVLVAQALTTLAAASPRGGIWWRRLAKPFG